MLSKPQLGVCTWTFGDLPLAQIARRVAALGFDGVELLGDLSLYTADEARETLAGHGLEVFSITPANVDLAHPDEAVRQEGLDYYHKLLDFAAALNRPLVSVHGFVGRVRPVTNQQAEYDLLVESVRNIASAAGERNLRLVFEVLNRYESHLINTAAEVCTFIGAVGSENLGILLDSYHMNIEEADPVGAIREAGERLWLYHIADSNRQAIGRGHIKFGDQLWALESIGYEGPTIVEVTAPGPDPFVPIKDEQSLHWLETYLRESQSWF